MFKDTFFAKDRFMALCRKEMVESWKVNGLRVILMYGVMTFVLFLIGYNNYSQTNYPQVVMNNVQDSSLIAFLCFIFIFACLSASFIMEKMKTKTSRLSTLMVPATSFEKFFSRWLMFTIVFMLVFLVTFLLADYTRVFVCSLLFPDVDIIKPTSLKYLFANNPGHFSACRSLSGYFLLLSAYCFSHSCFTLGSSIWPKNAFLKTFVALLLLIILYPLLGTAFAKLIISGSGFYHFSSNISEDTIGYMVSISLACLAMFNWILAYFRFKEAEIINRM